MAEREFALYVQVLQEFYWQARHEAGKVKLAQADDTDAVRSLSGGVYRT